MKRSLSAVIFLAAVAVATTAAGGLDVWTSHGPLADAGFFLAVVPDPLDGSRLYASTSAGGPMSSTDGGRNWQSLKFFASGDSLVAFVLDPTNSAHLWAVLPFGQGVYVSSNRGADWTNVSGSFINPYVYGVAFDPTAAGTVYAATGHGIQKTTDGGGTWFSSDVGISVSVSALAVDPSLSQTVYAASGSRVYRSINGGLSFTPRSGVTLFGTISELFSDPRDPALWALTDAGLFRSGDGGAAWTLVLPDGISFAFGAGVPPALVASTNSAVERSADSGATWTATALAEPAVLGYGAAAGIFWAGSGRVLLQSTDGGATWAVAEDAVQSASAVTALALLPGNPREVYAAEYAVFLSTDEGSRWRTLASSFPSHGFVNSLEVDPLAPGRIYAGLNVGGVFVSADGGETFSPGAGTSSAVVSQIAIDPAAAGSAWAATQNAGVLRSTDGGASWTPSSAGIPGVFIGSITMDPAGAVLYASAARDQGVFRSTDRGAHWSAASSGLTAPFVYSLTVDPGDASTIFAATTDGIFVTHDAAASWSRRGLSTVPILNLAVDPSNRAVLYAGSKSLGIFRSPDGGGSWSGFNTGLVARQIFAIVVSPDGRHLHAATAGGEFDRSSGPPVEPALEPAPIAVSGR